MNKKGAKYNFYSIHFQWYGRFWKPVDNEVVITLLGCFCSTILLMRLGKLEKKLLNLQSLKCLSAFYN